MTFVNIKKKEKVFFSFILKYISIAFIIYYIGFFFKLSRFLVRRVARLVISVRIVLALRVDDVIADDLGVARQLDPPVALGLVTLTALNLTKIVVVFLLVHFPVKLVVRDMRLKKT